MLPACLQVSSDRIQVLTEVFEDYKKKFKTSIVPLSEADGNEEMFRLTEFNIQISILQYFRRREEKIKTPDK